MATKTDEQLNLEREKRNERQREFAKNNREIMNERRRRYRLKHKEELRESRRLEKHRAKARSKELPCTLTVKEWFNSISYFGYCCPVCGYEYATTSSRKPHMDHWIAQSNPECPGLTVLNTIPLCGGQGGCNQRKGRLNGEEYVRRYFPVRADSILERIGQYFDQVRITKKSEEV